MDKWWKVAISAAVVLVLSLIFKIHNLPFGAGKIFSYLGIGVFPVLFFQLNLLKKDPPHTGFFIFALVMNTFLVLFFVIITKTIMTIISGINFI